MFGNFTEEARLILVRAKKEMYDLKHPYVGSEHLLLAILKEENSVTKRLKEFGLDYERLHEEITTIIGVGSKVSNWFLYTPLLKRILENAIVDSKENNNGIVTVEHLFSSLLEEGEGVAIRVMMGMNIDIDELYGEFSYKIAATKKRKKSKKLLLEELGTDVTKKAEQGLVDPVIGREKELTRVLEILSRRTKNNPLLIGEAGVGKTAIVEELSRRIASGEVPMNLKNKRIFSLDMASAVAGTKYRGEFEERIHKILKEIEENDDIILFIDEIHTLVGAGGAEGAIDASNIFKPALARNKLRCIGATTTAEYKKYIEKDSALERRFQTVVVDIPEREVVKEIILKLKSIYEKYHFVRIDESLVDYMIELSERYIYDRNEPDKTIDILDEVCAKVSLKESKDLKKYNQLKKELQEIIKEKNEAILNRSFEEASRLKEEENQYMDAVNELELKLYQNQNYKEVTKEDIAHVVSLKTKIPVEDLLINNKKRMEQLEHTLKKEIIGQEEAIQKTIHIAKKMKLGVKEKKQPYSLLFIGPSGVGKTALAKLFGEHFAPKNVIRLDMSEFMDAASATKILGAAPGYVGYDDNRNLLEEIRNKPYSVLILDEIEKAHPSILHLFLQALEEGEMKDATGRKIRFDQVVIIMTSNIGFEQQKVGFQEEKENNALRKLKDHFGLPFVNRIDQVIVFHTLEKKTIETLIRQKLQTLLDHYQKKQIKVQLSPSLSTALLKESQYEEFGARQLDKLIEDRIENQILDELLEGKEEVFIDHLVIQTEFIR